MDFQPDDRGVASSPMGKKCPPAQQEANDDNVASDISPNQSSVPMVQALIGGEVARVPASEREKRMKESSQRRRATKEARNTRQQAHQETPEQRAFEIAEIVRQSREYNNAYSTALGAKRRRPHWSKYWDGQQHRTPYWRSGYLLQEPGAVGGWTMQRSRIFQP